MQWKYDGSLEDAFHVAEVVDAALQDHIYENKKNNKKDAALLQACRLLILLVLLHLLHHPLKVVGVIHLRDKTNNIGKRTHCTTSSDPNKFSIT